MKRAADDDELLTVPEVAKETGISQDGVRIAIRAERLPAIKKGAMYLIRRGDMRAWKPRGWKPKKEKPDE